MQITDIKTFLVHPGTGKNWLLVKVETDEGVHGWGESYTQADRDRAIEAHIQAMKRYVIGRNPFDIKHFTSVMYLDFANKRGAMDFYSALSGIEQAMWDIAGKVADQPVYNLLGGRCRDKIRVYANGWGGERGGPLALAEAALAVVERGFTALKFDPFPGPWREIIDREQERKAVANVRAVRKAVGPNIDILIEAHRRLAPAYAVRMARLLEEFDPFWYEEPVSSRDMGGLAAVKRQVTLPVVTGEELYTKGEFRAVFEQQAADIINPDICNCGGILELKEIAAMAETYSVAVSPHNYNSTTVGLSATAHLCATIPNFLITEYFVNFEPVAKEVAIGGLVAENGYITLPTTPGLGLDIDERALARRPYQEFRARTIRYPGDEGP
ncbi:MAG: mandelate racemase/muconate lactonizing enzyme family protein [Chloroflexia bacterium]